MKYTAKAIADFLHGTIEGNPDIEISGPAKIENGTAGTLAFLANPKYEKYIYTTGASVVIVNKTFVPTQPLTCTLIRVDDAYRAFASLLTLAESAKETKKGIDKLAYVDPTAKIASDAWIGAFAYIGKNAVIESKATIHPQVYIGDNCTIGSNTVLHPGVKIYHECKIGNQVTIHAGSVVGSDGFGFAPKSDKEYQKIPQVGNVIIEDEVEIGSNCSIDRATIGSTIIRRGVKLDNLIQIAHNVEIGEHTVIVAQSGIAGSTHIGRECMIAGQVGIIGHLEIGNNVKIAAQSGISYNVADGDTVMGSPAYLINDYKKSYILFKNLPETRKQIMQLEKEIKELKEKLNHQS